MPLRNLVWLLVVPGLVGLGLAVGYSAPAPDKDYKLVRQFVEVLAEVDANYVRELTDEERQKFIEDAISGGLRKLDPHSTYLNEKQLKEFETENEGAFDGIGVLLGQDEKTKLLKVVAPFVGGSAYDAGLVVGDLITKIGDDGTKDMSTEEAAKRIKGERNTKVTLTISRGGREFSVTVTRARIFVHPVSGVSRKPEDPTKWNWMLDGPNKIGYIRVSSFNELTTKEVEAALKEIEDAGARGLILDLRENPGGLLSEAVKLADLFLTEGKIVTTKDRRESEKSYSAKGAGTAFLPAEQKPMVVLVNHNSASSAEIVAAALQDAGRAVVVGARTYGKGSVQTVFRLPPDQKAAVKLTTQTWWRPSGKNMDQKSAPKDRPDEWGVTPNEGMEIAVADPEYVRFRIELQKLDYVVGRPDVVKQVFGDNPPPPPPLLDRDGKPLVDESKPFDDRQLTKALDYIKKKLGVVALLPGRAIVPAGVVPA